MPQRLHNLPQMVLPVDEQVPKAGAHGKGFQHGSESWMDTLKAQMWQNRGQTTLEHPSPGPMVEGEK